MGLFRRDAPPAQVEMRVPDHRRVAQVEAGARVDTEGREYRRALLARFEDARVTRDLALELNTRAERAMVEALAKYDEARKAVRRISELDRDR